MPSRNHDLHGFAPHKNDTALLLIDVINDLDFPEGRQILPAAIAMAQQIAVLKRRARRSGVPSIYVNDNFGLWRSDFQRLVNHCTAARALGRPIVELLKPVKNDYFVLKPKHSGFYSTTLDTLLQYLDVKRVIVTGIAGNICVLFTANDAYMRDLNLLVPSDCVVSNTPEENQHALEQMKRVLKANIGPSRKSNSPSARDCDTENKSGTQIASLLPVSGLETINRRLIMLSTILIVLLVLALLGAVPAWGYSRDWGFGPSGGIGLVLLILVILALTGRL